MASFRPVGKRVRAEVCKLGIRDSAYFENKSEAKAWASRREAEILEGAGKKTAKHTLHEALDRYAETVSPKRKGCRWEQVRLARFKRELADTLLSAVTTDTIARWRDDMLQTKKGASVRRDMEVLRSVFEVARREWGWVKANPCTDARKPAKSPHRTRIIADKEVKAICAALGYAEGCAVLTKKQETAVAFLLALETGMRAGEVLRAQVRGKAAVLATTKNGQPREVPLSKRAKELFKKVKTFTLSPGTLDANFRKARDLAGVEGVTFHDSRHTACTRLAKLLDPLTLAKVLGHKDLKHTLIYYNPTTEDIADRLG